MQELFLRLRAAPGFAAARDRPAYAWRAAINLASTWRRRARLQTPAPLADDVAAFESDPAQPLIRREDYERVLDALTRVSRAARAAFVLRLIEQQPYADVAAALGTTPHQARALCQKAMRRIRDILNVSVERGNPRETAR